MTQADISIISGSVGVIFGAGISWGILRTKVMNTMISVDVLRKRMEDHEKSKSPHASCPAHDATLQAILASLADIKADMKTLTGQILVLTKDIAIRSSKQR